MCVCFFFNSACARCVRERVYVSDNYIHQFYTPNQNKKKKSRKCFTVHVIHQVLPTEKLLSQCCQLLHAMTEAHNEFHTAAYTSLEAQNTHSPYNTRLGEGRGE